MRSIAYVGIIFAGTALASMTVPGALRQSRVASDDRNTVSVHPRQPGGLLGDQPGTYLTIEGVKPDGVKEETRTLVVDTVNGTKLGKTVSLVIRGAVIVDHNLQPARLELPAKQRCILRGFESGEMIGVPPAIAAADQEQGWQEVPLSPKHWQWRSYFVALVVVEPNDVELRTR